MSKQDEFVPSASDIRLVRTLYSDTDKRVRNDFPALTFDQLVHDYILATRAVNELLHAEGGEFMLEARCDGVAQHTHEVVRNLRQYKLDVVEYFDSLREQTTKL